MATEIKLLNADRMPNSSLKLSTVSRTTIEVNSGFEGQLSKVTSAYDVLSTSLTAIKNVAENDLNNHKKDFDSKTIASLNTLTHAAKNQVKECNARKKYMKSWADKDVKDLEDKARRQVWKQAAKVLSTDVNLSEDSRKMLKILIDYL